MLYTQQYNLASFGPGVLSLFIIFILWSLVFKALALWKAARRGEKIWFIVFLILNTAGVLEIIYLILKREPKTITTPQV